MSLAEPPDLHADRLLAMHAVEPDAPAYTVATFDYKLRRAQVREPIIARKLAERTPDPLRRDEVRALMRSARLTPTQLECLSLRLDGFTFADIGALAGTSKQSAQASYLAALGKLRRAWCMYRYAGLADVYRRESLRCRGGKPS